MKTDRVRELLAAALQAAPEFALEEVRSHIRAAMVKLDRVAKKRELREHGVTPGVVRVAVSGAAPWQDVQKQVALIDDMIASEKHKLDEITRRKKPSEGDEQLQAIFG